MPYTFILLINHDLSINPRFVIPLVWLLSPVVAAALACWLIDGRPRYRLRFGATMLAVLGFGAAALAVQWDTVQKYYFDYTASQARMYQAMQGMEDRAVVVAGPGAPVAWYFDRLKIKDFEIIGSGWDWPGEGLDQLVADRIADGRPVYADLNRDDWTRTVRHSSEWDQLFNVAVKYEWELPPTSPVPPTENFMFRLKAHHQTTSSTTSQTANP